MVCVWLLTSVRYGNQVVVLSYTGDYAVVAFLMERTLALLTTLLLIISIHISGFTRTGKGERIHLKYLLACTACNEINLLRGTLRQVPSNAPQGSKPTNQDTYRYLATNQMFRIGHVGTANESRGCYVTVCVWHMPCVCDWQHTCTNWLNMECLVMVAWLYYFHMVQYHSVYYNARRVSYMCRVCV